MQLSLAADAEAPLSTPTECTALAALTLALAHSSIQRLTVRMHRPARAAGLWLAQPGFGGLQHLHSLHYEYAALRAALAGLPGCSVTWQTMIPTRSQSSTARR